MLSKMLMNVRINTLLVVVFVWCAITYIHFKGLENIRKEFIYHAHLYTSLLVLNEIPYLPN